jgi:hypothetical protein
MGYFSFWSTILIAKAALQSAGMVEKSPKEIIVACGCGHMSDDTFCSCAGAEDGCETVRDRSGAKPKPCPELKQVVIDEFPADLPISQQEILMLLEALNAEIGDLLAC